MCNWCEKKVKELSIEKDGNLKLLLSICLYDEKNPMLDAHVDFKDFEMLSVCKIINFCPMCGRQLPNSKE